VNVGTWALGVYKRISWHVLFMTLLNSLALQWCAAQHLRPEIVEQSGHTNSVDALVFTPDRHWLISAGHDFSIRLWDLHTYRQVRILGRHTREINTVEFVAEFANYLAANLAIAQDVAASEPDLAPALGRYKAVVHFVNQ
jgi:WD40 repeat protein